MFIGAPSGPSGLSRYPTMAGSHPDHAAYHQDPESHREHDGHALSMGGSMAMDMDLLFISLLK